MANYTYGLFAGGLLQPGSQAEMLRFVAAPDSDVPGQTGYGLGVRRLRIGAEDLVGHTGVFPGFSNVTVYSPDHGYVVTVLSNLSTVQVNQVIAAIQPVLVA